jgi:hypothetical protein
MQIYQTQNRNIMCPPSTPREVCQELIPRAIRLPKENQEIRTLVLDTDADFCSYFEQPSMIQLGTITQVSVRPAPILYNIRHLQK